MTQLTKTGEVAELSQADQFQAHKSQFECGWFSGYVCKSASPVGHTPALSPQGIIDGAEGAYASVYGSNDISVEWGMSDAQEYTLLEHLGLHYQASDPSWGAEVCRAWLKLGYLVMVGIVETSAFDLDLDRNPYPWTPSGNHIIVLSGVTSSGDFLVRDCANCTSLFDPNSLRPGPRRYSASHLQFISITGVVPYWMPRPPAGFDPRKDTLMSIPNGWKASTDNLSIIAPNGKTATRGFMNYIKSNAWDEGNVPLEEEHGMSAYAYLGLGTNGTGQLYRDCYLRWDGAHTPNIYKAPIGEALVAMMKTQNPINQEQLKAILDQMTPINILYNGLKSLESK